jgi:hypothetical protein
MGPEDHSPMGGPARVTSPQDRERLIRYLLGTLPPGEGEALEADYFRDDDAFAALQATEQELLDACIRGDMDERRRQEVLAHYGASREGRQKLQFARALLKMADERAVPWSHPRPHKWQALAVAATLALIALAGWQLWDLRGTGRGLDLTWRTWRGVRSSPGPTDQPSPDRDPLRPTTVAVPAAPSRSAASTLVRVPPDVSVVRIHLLLDGERFPSYAADVVAADGAEVWRARGLRPRATPQPAVALLLDADLVPPGEYVATLSGERDGSGRDVGTYPFRVHR